MRCMKCSKILNTFYQLLVLASRHRRALERAFELLRSFQSNSFWQEAFRGAMAIIGRHYASDRGALSLRCGPFDGVRSIAQIV